MVNDTVWIIVPVYNAQKTLKKCVKSVQKQTYTNWKLILVDDGSKDKSGEMCDKFAAKDNRIIAIHQPNAGPSAARKAGVALIPDDGYCAFCDSDDWMPKDALSILINAAKRDESDIVCGKMMNTFKNFVIPKQSFQTCFSNPGKYNHDEMMSKLYVACFGAFVFPVTLCGKIFKIKKLKEIIFDICKTPEKYAEDLDVLLRLMPKVNSTTVVDKVVYYYQYGGGTCKFMKTFLSDSCFMYNRKKEHAEYYHDKDLALRMCANEIVSFSISHLIMCERFETYPHKNLQKEIEYVCRLPEIRDALILLGADDSGHFIGTGEALVSLDYLAIEDFVLKKVEERKHKDAILKLLFK